MVTLPGGYDGNVMPDTEAVYGNPGPASRGTSGTDGANVDTHDTAADYFGTQTDTITINHTTATALHRVGITSTPAKLVVFDVTTSTPLVLTTDYTVTTTGSGATTTYSITRNNSSSASADGDTVTVAYQWGNDAAWSSANGEYGPSALKYGNYGDSASGLYPGVSTTLDNEHVGLLVGGTQPAYAAEPLVPPTYGLTGTIDTGNVNFPSTPGVNPAYRVPNLQIGYVGGSGSAETSWTDRPLSDGTVRPDLYQTISTTLESANVGAPVAATVQVDSFTFNHTTPTAFTQVGVVTPSASIVVYDVTTSTPLVAATDYTLAASGQGDQRAFTIVRVNASSASADGDTVRVTYSYGSPAYFQGYAPSGAVPAAPTIGSVTGVNEGVNVNWTAPSASLVPISGYLVQNSTGGTEYAPANATSMQFGGVNGHGTLTPNVNYTFRVAAWNNAGVGAFSAYSAVAQALNTGAVPTGSLDPNNTTNPVYAPDGTVHASTGTGSGGGGPRPPQSVSVTSTVTGRVDVTWAAPSSATTPTPPEEGPSGYTIAFSTGKVVTVGKNVLALNTTGFTTAASVTVTVTAVGSIQNVSALPQTVTVH